MYALPGFKITCLALHRCVSVKNNIIIKVHFYSVLLPIAEMIGSCGIIRNNNISIGGDRIGDVIDWACITNVQGVSLICLLNGILVEDCLCKLYMYVLSIHYTYFYLSR